MSGVAEACESHQPPDVTLSDRLVGYTFDLRWLFRECSESTVVGFGGVGCCKIRCSRTIGPGPEEGEQ